MRESIAFHLRHHVRFYSAALFGLLVFFAARRAGNPFPLAAAGDAFFLTFLAAAGWLVFQLSDRDLDRRASQEDEGMFVVLLISLTASTLTSIDIFTALNQRHRPDELSLVLALASAPLGWTVLHVISAFHYANLYYLGPDPTCTEAFPLKFPGTDRPGPWDFIYFSFVVGMTAQVSDVLVQSTTMRRAVMSHSVASFFFNTVLIAMAVNAVIALAS